jgi:thioredoxin reductase (NADPH)
VMIVHRRGEARACKCLMEKAINEPRIRFLYNTEVTEIIGDKRVSGVRLSDLKTGESRVVEADGVLLAIGWDPNTSILRGHIELDEAGFPQTTGVKTVIKGVFIAGDLIDKTYRQVVTSCGSGCAAALEAVHWLDGGTGG